MRAARLRQLWQGGMAADVSPPLQRGRVIFNSRRTSQGRWDTRPYVNSGFSGSGALGPNFAPFGPELNNKFREITSAHFELRTIVSGVELRSVARTIPLHKARERGIHCRDSGRVRL